MNDGGKEKHTHMVEILNIMIKGGDKQFTVKPLMKWSWQMRINAKHTAWHHSRATSLAQEGAEVSGCTLCVGPTDDAIVPTRDRLNASFYGTIASGQRLFRHVRIRGPALQPWLQGIRTSRAPRVQN